MIKQLPYFLFGCIFFAFPLQAALERIELTKEEILINLSRNEQTRINTMFDLCAGRISIQVNEDFDCSGILETMKDDYHDFKDIIEYLHQKNKLIDILSRTNREGQTILHIIAHTSNISFLQVLVQYRICLDQIDSQGNTPAHIVALHQENPRGMLNILQEYGADLNLINNARETVNAILKQKAYTSFYKANTLFYTEWLEESDAPSNKNYNEDDLEENIAGYCSIS